MGRLIPQQLRQRLKTRFNGNLPAGAALGLIGQVEVFQLGFAQGGVDGAFQLIAQFALFADGLEDSLAALFQFAQVAKTGLKRAVTSLR